MTDNEIIKALGRMSCKTLNDCKLINNALSLINRQNAEIERLKEHIKDGIDLAKQLPEMVALAEAEAIKEFAERLKETFPEIDWLRSTKRISEDIDNLVKEMVGDVG